MVKIDRAYRNISRNDIECDLFFSLADHRNSLHERSGELSNVNVKWDRESVNGGGAHLHKVRNRTAVSRANVLVYEFLGKFQVEAGS